MPSKRDELTAELSDIQEGSANAQVTARDAIAIARRISRAGIPAYEKAVLRYYASSLIINAGADLDDVDVLVRGQEVAQAVVDATTPERAVHFAAMYNVANSMISQIERSLPRDWDSESFEAQRAAHRRQHRERLRQVRRLLFTVGSAEIATPESRSGAYCNLANVLDESGRWAEAYDFYLKALEVDPRNGNAAGNLAALLQRRLIAGIGQVGHIAAVYDEYVRRAQALRDGTVTFAGNDVADRWDSLPLTESEGHLEHGLEGEDDDYRNWVARYRLALSPAVEGLGSDDAHWDSAVIPQLFGDTPESVTPPILAEMNVLKSDFLVSRELAYLGISQILTGPGQQREDSGYYVDTEDSSLYGMQYSKLLLAQRSALDVLDKTAVVANEYFGTGDAPDQVNFREYWARRGGEVRPELIKCKARALAPFVLSELAYDMGAEGMYAPSQGLRNAGTHRIVHAALLRPTGVTVDARSRVDLVELRDSTVLALQVTRSAYLYLIDLVASWNHPDDHQGLRATVVSSEQEALPPLIGPGLLHEEETPAAADEATAGETAS